MMPASCAATKASPLGSVAARNASAAAAAAAPALALARCARRRFGADVDHRQRAVGGDMRQFRSAHKNDKSVATGVKSFSPNQVAS
jgi:hypothetical protein